MRPPTARPSQVPLLSMASGRQSRRRRQEGQAPPPPRSTGRRREISPRILIGGVALLVLVGLGVGLGVGLSGGSSSAAKTVPSLGSLESPVPNAAEIETMLKGIPQRGNVLGEPT